MQSRVLLSTFVSVRLTLVFAAALEKNIFLQIDAYASFTETSHLYYYIKENLLSLMSGCLRTPPKLEGLGQ